MNADRVRAVYRRGAEHQVSIRRYFEPVLSSEDESFVLQIEETTELLELESSFSDYPALAKLTGQPVPQLLGEGVAQYGMRAIVLVDDLVAGGFNLPLTTDDKLLWNNREWAIEVPDGATKYAGGALIAYDLRITG